MQSLRTDREHLNIDGGLVAYGCHLPILQAMRSQILQSSRITSRNCSHKATYSFDCVWPGIDNDIENVVLSCKHCQDHLPSNPKQPIVSKSKTSHPFQEILVDFCTYSGQTYLINIDYFTDWPDIVFIDHNTTAFNLIQVLKKSLCRIAIPDKPWSDGSPQFTLKKFNEFQAMGFLYKTTPSHYPQSNGKVKATVKSMKKLISTPWNGHKLNEDHLCRALPH